MSWLVGVANKLPAPARDRLQRLRWRIDALGVPRLRWWTKARMVRSYCVPLHAPAGLRYVLLDPELANFTYELGNRDELGAFVADAFGTTNAEVEGYFRETEEDPELNERLHQRLRRRKDRKRTPLFGRRLGWYAIARILKPSAIVETGIHDGLGSTAILQALHRNALEGVDGRLVSMDVTAESGWLIPDRLRDRLEVRIGRSLDVIPEVLKTSTVDVFIHDSDHRYQYELDEYQAIRELAAPAIVYMSDNAHATRALRDFAADQGLAFTFWKEAPVGHFVDGAGIGLALRQPPGSA
jgi:hypothetical protein